MTAKGTSDTMPAGMTGRTPQGMPGHHLNQLKLPTVLREYDKVARDCARDVVDHRRMISSTDMSGLMAEGIIQAVSSSQTAGRPRLADRCFGAKRLTKAGCEI
jgi:hypothetical protein